MRRLRRGFNQHYDPIPRGGIRAEAIRGDDETIYGANAVTFFLHGTAAQPRDHLYISSSPFSSTAYFTHHVARGKLSMGPINYPDPMLRGRVLR